MASERSWQQTRRNDAFDVALTAVLGLAAGTSLYMGGDPELVGADFADYSRPVGIALLIVGVLPIALRRRFPATVFAVTTAAYVLQVLMGIPEQAVAVAVVFIAFYTTGAYGGRGRNLVRAVCAAALLVLVVLSATVVDTTGFMSELQDLDTFVPAELFLAFYVFQNSFYFAGAWMLGDMAWSRRQREAELEATAEHLRRAQAENARQAVLEERVHIARELHDVVAHHVAVMGVQAGAARHVFSRQPEEVPKLLSTVEESSRHAIDELRRMLGVLREEQGPTPALGQLDELVEQMRHAGLSIETDFDEVTPSWMRDLPHHVDRVGYRIVQEALTNTVKHAGPDATARLSLACGSDVLEIRVADDGPVPNRNTNSDGGRDRRRSANGAPRRPDGYGLTGMRERVATLGGQLDAGPLPQGGFEVRARLPLADDRPAVAADSEPGGR